MLAVGQVKSINLAKFGRSLAVLAKFRNLEKVLAKLAKFINFLKKKCWPRLGQGPSLWISPSFGQVLAKVYESRQVLAKFMAKFMNLAKFWPSLGQVYESCQVLAKFMNLAKFWPSFGQVYESRQVLAKFWPSLFSFMNHTYFGPKKSKSHLFWQEKNKHHTYFGKKIWNLAKTWRDS